MEHLNKFLSLILRHKPGVIGVELDAQGWVSVDDVVSGMKKAGKNVEISDILSIVASDGKTRYSLKNNNTMIRANQGHSIPVDLELVAVTPPDALYHGTTIKFIDIIKSEGLKRMQRHHVHLSGDIKTALAVGSRRGEPVLIYINSRAMKNDGIEFYKSENGVWLTDFVDPKYFSDILTKEQISTIESIFLIK
jgi:putative RNA 2'-phosphotransferase